MLSAIASPYMDSSFFASFSLSIATISKTQLHPYIRPIIEGFITSGPDGFPRVFVSINLPASKALGLHGFLKTPV